MLGSIWHHHYILSPVCCVLWTNSVGIMNIYRPHTTTTIIQTVEGKCDCIVVQGWCLWKTVVLWELHLISDWTQCWWFHLRWPVISSPLRDSDSRGRRPGETPDRLPLSLHPYEHNTHPPFWCLSRQLCCTCGIQLGFVHQLLSAALPATSVDSYLSKGNVCTVTFQWGFAEWIGETHLNLGLKLWACSDSLITTSGYFPLFFFCTLWEIHEKDNKMG